MENNEQVVMNKTEKPNSYEVGKPSARHKIYYDTPDDLKTQIDKLIELGLYVEE